MLYELKGPHLVQDFRSVLRNNQVTSEMLNTEEDRKVVENCFKKGWQYTTTDKKKTKYIFTTYLHQWFIEYYLGTRVLDSASVRDLDLLALQSSW